jgi:hypothetical protein
MSARRRRAAQARPTRHQLDLPANRSPHPLPLPPGVSMGQGQEVIARRYMATAIVEGQWVLLQNTHLGLGYLTEVEQFLTKAEDLHEDFRLWITAEPHPQFPIGLLQVGALGCLPGGWWQLGGAGGCWERAACCCWARLLMQPGFALHRRWASRSPTRRPWA